MIEEKVCEVCGTRGEYLVWDTRPLCRRCVRPVVEGLSELSKPAKAQFTRVLNNDNTERQAVQLSFDFEGEYFDFGGEHEKARSGIVDHKTDKGLKL